MAFAFARSSIRARSVPLQWAALAFVVLTVTAAGQGTGAGAPQAQPPLPSTPKAQAKSVPRPDDEAVALAFVRENHPELAELLAQLKPMKPLQYQKAIRDLAQVSRTLGDLKTRDAKRYEFGLDAWKTRSRVELLAARLASAAGSSPELESQLRQAVEEQVDHEILRLRFERDQAEERLKRTKENLERAESRRDSMIQNRYKAQLKSAEKARPKPAGPDTKTKTNAPATRPEADTKSTKPKDKGETQP